MTKRRPKEVKESKRVVARFRDGGMVKGTLLDFSPDTGSVKVLRSDRWIEEIIDLEGLKSLFFVKTYGGRSSYNERKDFEIANEFGRRATIRFYDGEELWGYVLAAELSDPERRGFFFFPVDPESNNLKLYILRSAITSITLT